LRCSKEENQARSLLADSGSGVSQQLKNKVSFELTGSGPLPLLASQGSLTLWSLFAEAPGLEAFDSASSAALDERLAGLVAVSPRKVRRVERNKSKARRILIRELLQATCGKGAVSLTPAAVEAVYREMHERLPRSGQHGFEPDLHTRNVYNAVADAIFSQAKAEVEPYIINCQHVPSEVAERYMALRNANKRFALVRTSPRSASSIASRNSRKYGNTHGPASGQLGTTSLIAKKGTLGAVLGSFSTRGRDLLLWGNEAGDKIDTWRWLNGSVKSPWRVSEAQVRTFKASKLHSTFGGSSAKSG